MCRCCVTHSWRERPSCRTVDGRRLTSRRATPPCRLVLPRDVVDQRQLMMLSWRRSRSLDVDARRMHVPVRHDGHTQPLHERPADTTTHDACWLDDDDTAPSRDHHVTRSQDDDHERASTLQAATSVDCTSVDCVSSVGCDCSPTSADRRLCQQQHPARRRRGGGMQQAQSDARSPPGKKRLTLSCVMADVSGLLRCMRRLRVTRDHETCV